MKTIVFDLDNTLVLRNQAMINCIAQEFNLSLNSSQVEQIKIQDDKGHSNRLEFSKWINSFLDLKSSPQTIWGVIKSNIAKYVLLNESAESVLNKLYGNYNLVLFTNGGSLNQRQKITASGLSKYFNDNYIFISEEIGFNKPNPKAFEYVSTHFQKDTEFFMIGDHFENDILGAINFGWQAVYLGSDQDYENSIHSLSELLVLLK